MTLAMFLVYSIAVAVFGIVMSRGRDKSGADFLLGGRSLPLFLSVGTMFATIIGTGSSMGCAGLGYTQGLGGAIFLLASGAGIILGGYVFSPLRRYRLMTFPEEIALYYGSNKTLRSFVALTTAIGTMGSIASHMIGGATYLEWITGLPVIWSRILVTLAFGLYVIVGGYMAVVWTDLIQGIILGIGFIFAAILGVRAAGGWSTMVSELPEGFMSLYQLAPLAAFGMFLSKLTGTMTAGVYHLRIFSANSEKTAKKAFIRSGLMTMAFAFLPVVLGMAARAVNPGLEKPDFAFPYMLTSVFPPVLGSLFLISGISATASSADSDVASAVSTILNDVYRIFTGRTPSSKQIVPLSRISTLVILVGALILGFAAKGVIDMMVLMASVFGAGSAVIVLMGRFWKRATWQGAIAAKLIGAAVALLVRYHPVLKTTWSGYASIIPPFFTALIAGVAVSLLTPKEVRSWDEVAEELAEQRQELEKVSA
jgi:SSS family solute:Na+ symporter